MKNLPKEKRKQLILVLLLVVMALSGLWFGLIAFQQQKLRTVAAQKDIAEKKLKEVELAIKNAGQIETDLVESGKKLAELESGMAPSDDIYSWAINMLRKFKQPYKVEIPQFSGIDGPRPTTLLPDFPYQQVSLTVGGTAFFQDFGRFLADFENQFPYVRVLNLTLEPSGRMVGVEQEKLSFKINVAMLVKPSSPQ